MEVGIIAGLAYWGLHTGRSTTEKLVMSIGSPVLVFGFWGIVDFHQVRQYGELLRLTQELVLSFLAAMAIYATGQHTCGLVLAILSIVHHFLVYAVGEKLLKR